MIYLQEIYSKIFFHLPPFELYFDEEVINYLTEMTNLYSNRDKGKHSFHVDHSEMRLFVAMLLLSGYNVLSRRRMYWDNSEDVHNESMSRAMSRNRFEKILSALHCSDNYNLDSEDKMAKVRPLYNLINKRCLKYSSDFSSICVDKWMLPYYGRHSSKQRIAGKPIRMGYKMWVLAESMDMWYSLTLIKMPKAKTLPVNLQQIGV